MADLGLQTLWAIPWFRAVSMILGSLVAGLIFDKVIARLLLALSAKTRTDLDDKLVAVLHRPIFWSVSMTGFWWAVHIIGLPRPASFVAYGTMKTAAVVLWTQAFARVGSILMEWLSKAQDRFRVVQPRTLPIFDIAVKVVVYGGGIYAFMLAWSIDVTGWLASAGILGLAIGFAAKDTLANLFAGVFILADAPYKLGDYVVLGSGERGKVIEIGMRSTRILTRDDIEIVVPNSSIANGKIVNESGGPAVRRRLRVKVGVAYGSDIDHVRQVLLDIAQQDGEVLDDPYPRVRFRSFGDSALEFDLLCWVAEPEWKGRILDKLNTKVYKRFAEENIQIPFPQRDVHLIPASDAD